MTNVVHIWCICVCISIVSPIVGVCGNSDPNGWLMRTAMSWTDKPLGSVLIPLTLKFHPRIPEHTVLRAPHITVGHREYAEYIKTIVARGVVFVCFGGDLGE